MFSSAVRQFGFPYRWVQRLCGINVPADSQDGGRVLPEIEVAASYVGSAIAMLRQRFRAQVNLTRQLIALGWPVGVGVGVHVYCVRVCTCVYYVRVCAGAYYYVAEKLGVLALY